MAGRLETWREWVAAGMRCVLLAAVVLTAPSTGNRSLAQTRPTGGGDILLTFDTEFENDAESILALGIDVPATYFWTGEYAKKYPDLLRRLARQGNTIGSHSFAHDDLTKISRRQAQLDLELAKLVLEEIAGVPITAFRAPYLQHDDPVMAEVERLGFLIDSSDKSPWPRNQRLLEIAVSEFENVLVSDYDIFETLHLDNLTGSDFLIRAYAEHSARGQPFVLLLHPRVIGRHPDVLHDFIEHVENRGGRFLTLNDYMDSLIVAAEKRRVEIWAELGPDVSVETLVAAVEEGGATDLILSLPDDGEAVPPGPTLVAATVAAIQAHGVRVQLAFPVMMNPALSAALPTAVMMDIKGVPSTEWVSPSHPEVRRRLADKAERLVSRLGVNGIHLFGIGYPGLDWDFSPAALQRFSAASGTSGVSPEEVLSHHYLNWTQWRSREVTLLVAEIANAARSEREDVFVSASLLPEAAVNFRVQESTGQDYRKLGHVVDLIVPSISPFLAQDTSAIARLMLVIRTQAGSVPVLAGVNMSRGHAKTGFRTTTLLTLSQVLALRSTTLAEVTFGPRISRPDRYWSKMLSDHFAAIPATL